MPVQQWMRSEWQRSGLPLSRANEACGVANAATRKDLTQAWLWDWPPAAVVHGVGADDAKAQGRECGWPYYSLDGQTAVTAKEWDSLSHKWKHAHGLTNVWQLAPLH